MCHCIVFGINPRASMYDKLYHALLYRTTKAIIEALTKALTDIKGSPTDSLKPPTFDWNSSEQFEDFRLFIKGMESWYTLQGIPDKDGDTTRLEYLLNFLGPIR